METPSPTSTACSKPELPNPLGLPDVDLRKADKIVTHLTQVVKLSGEVSLKLPASQQLKFDLVTLSSQAGDLVSAFRDVFIASTGETAEEEFEEVAEDTDGFDESDLEDGFDEEDSFDDGEGESGDEYEESDEEVTEGDEGSDDEWEYEDGEEASGDDEWETEGDEDWEE